MWTFKKIVIVIVLVMILRKGVMYHILKEREEKLQLGLLIREE